jgi:deoxyribonuclease-4
MSIEKYNTVCCLNWEAGAHTQFSKNIYKTLKKSLLYSMTVTQFFLGSPKSFTRHRVSQEDIDICKKLLTRYPLHVFSHFPYVANFAGSVKQLAWSGDIEQDIKTQFIINELEYELSVMSNFSQGGKRNGVVIHPGNYKNRLLGIEAISKSINKINFTEGSTLLLENAAGKGCSLATTFEEIKEIIDQVIPEKQKHVGVCIDTAHLCGWGEYDLSQCSEVTRMFEDFDRIIGVEKFTLLHLNDSVVPCGSKKDHHALLGTGHIWTNSFKSLVLLLDTCKKYGIPIMLETDCIDMFVLGALSESLNQGYKYI